MHAVETHTLAIRHGPTVLEVSLTEAVALHRDSGVGAEHLLRACEFMLEETNHVRAVDLLGGTPISVINAEELRRQTRALRRTITRNRNRDGTNEGQSDLGYRLLSS